ncbi:MAG: DotA/TraY family protein [Acidobacteriaceae bacterium]
MLALPSPPSTDYFLNTMAMILGPIVPKVTGVGGADHLPDSTTALAILLGWLNTIALYVAVVWVLYNGFVGILKSAHEGEWLGQRWSALWIPLRIALSVAMVLPVIPAGNGTGASYSGIQALLVWVEGASVGIADKGWSLTAQYIVKNPIGGVTISHAAVRHTADAILQDEVCAAAVNRSTSSGVVTNIAKSFGIPTQVSLQSTPYNTIEDYGDSAWNHVANGGDRVLWDQTYHPTGVGYWSDQWTVPGGSSVAARFAGQILGLTDRAVCGGINYPYQATGSSLASQVDNAVYTATAGGINQILIPQIQTIATEIVNRQQPSVQAYHQIVQNFESTVLQQSVQGIAAVNNPAEQKFLNQVNTQGFATAGSWWWEMAKLNQTAQNAINGFSTENLWSLSDLNSVVLGKQFQRAMRRGAGFIKNYKDTVKPGPDGSPTSAMETNDGLAGGISYLMHYVGSGMLWVADQSNTNQNPILGISAMGSSLLMVGMAVKFGPTMAKRATSILAIAQGGMDPAADAAAIAANAAAPSGKSGGMVSTLALGLIGVGVILSVWIPMLPYLIWTVAIFTLILYFVEAVFAAPFFAIAHMNPEGHEVVGSAGPGWMHVLQILLRPVLMVGGFVAGTAVLYAGAWIVQHTIGGAIMETFENDNMGFVGILDAIAEVVIYIVLVVIFINASFGLVHKLPDLVFGWIGGGNSDRGSEGLHRETEGGKESFRGHAHNTLTAVPKEKGD